MDRPDPRVGTVLAGRYKILERTTAGSMGVVYRAERVALKRAVAIKFLNEGYAGTEDGLRRFEVEARATSRLEHPNCVPVTDYGVDQGAPYLVMDFVKGITLQELLMAEWRLVPVRAVAIMRQVLAGLAHAHAQRILHRDVKPANIMVSPVEGHGEHVRIVDFGLAKLRDEGSFTTGVALGTPTYMSPEQTVGEKADERADIYACGVILYELLTGAKPFQAESPFEVMRLHREVAPVPLATAAAGVPITAGLEAVVMRAMAKARDDRYPTMSEFRTALDAVDEARTGREADPPRRRGGRGIPVPLVGLGLVVIAAGAFVAWWQWGRGQPAATDAADAPAVARAAAAEPDAGRAAPVEAPRVDAGSLDPWPSDPSPAADPPPEDPAPVAATATATQIERLRAVATEGGKLRGVIAGLERVRRADPKAPTVHYALANTYAEDQKWPQAIRSYAATLRLDAGYRSDPRLVADVVEALGSRTAHAQAAKLIEQELRDTALPRLEEASRSTNRHLRGRARKLRARLR